MYALAYTTGIKRTQPIIRSVDALNILKSGSGLKSHSQTTLINGQEQPAINLEHFVNPIVEPIGVQNAWY